MPSSAHARLWMQLVVYWLILPTFLAIVSFLFMRSQLNHTESPFEKDACHLSTASGVSSRYPAATPATDRPRPHVLGSSEYQTLYKQSMDDPLGFWAHMAETHLSWDKTFTKTFGGDFVQGTARWFEDGELNVAYNCVDRHAKVAPDRVALIYEPDDPNAETRHVTYGELCKLSSQIAAYLIEIGAKKGSTVTIYMPMMPETVAAMLACTRIGAAHNVVFAGFSAEALGGRVIDAGSRIILTADSGIRGGKKIPLKAVVDAAIAKAAFVEKVLVFKRTGDLVQMKEGRDYWWQEQIPRQPEYLKPLSMSAESPLFMLYTSGSTGKPKGLVHSSAGYLLYAMLTVKYVFDLQAGDIFGCLADIGWITGHSYVVYGPLANGVTTVIFESTPFYPDAERYWQTIEKHGITQLYTAPTVIRALRRLGDQHPKSYEMKTLRVLGTVGEPINADAWMWYREAVGKGRCPVVDTYWQTETGGHVIAPLPYATITKAGSATVPFFGIDAKVVDQHSGKVLEGGNQDGVLVIGKPWPGLARTIHNDHSKFVQTYFQPYPGFYFSGDRVHRDVDNYFWIRGRVDDVINVSGHRLSTAEIEAALGRHPACAEAAVLGRSDEVTGQSIWAFAILKPDPAFASASHGQLAKEMILMVREVIGPIAAPKSVLVVDDLPKTRSGKIMRRVLRKILAGETSKEQLGDLSTLNDPLIIERLVAMVEEADARMNFGKSS